MRINFDRLLSVVLALLASIALFTSNYDLSTALWAGAIFFKLNDKR